MANLSAGAVFAAIITFVISIIVLAVVLYFSDYISLQFTDGTGWTYWIVMAIVLTVIIFIVGAIAAMLGGATFMQYARRNNMFEGY